MLTLAQHKKHLEGHDILIAFEGEINVDVINATLHTVEDQLNNSNFPMWVHRKLYNVLVEALQNIFHHRLEEEESDYKQCIFSVSYCEEQFHIYTGNYCFGEAVPVITKKLNEINNLSQAEIVSRYREVLDDGIVTEKGGSGLGFLDMVRKSKNNLGFKFLGEETYTFFVLHILINANRHGQAKN